MSQACVSHANWYKSLSFAERCRSLRTPEDNTPDGLTVDYELAARRLQRWRSRPPLAQDDYFVQRLTMDGVSKHDLDYLLGETAESLHQRSPEVPEWLQHWRNAFKSPSLSPQLSALLTQISNQTSTEFISVVAPLVDQGRARLRQDAQALADRSAVEAFDADQVESLFITSLASQMSALLSRTMILELNVARLQGQLQGSTASERFVSFIERLRDPEAVLTLFEEYPVLARLLTICVDSWVDVSLEFLTRLCNDWKMLCTTFNAGQPIGRLVKVNASVGDKHRSGRSVIIARFESGLQIVYKPRSLAIDVHFQTLIRWLNERYPALTLYEMQVLNCGSYGWAEYIVPQPCESPEELERFYQRQGRYLALMHVLGATDFHFENIIAMGEHPVLIDLESLFHPYHAQFGRQQSRERAALEMDRSVLRVGMLPKRAWAGVDSDGVDMSGLGTLVNQMSPRPAQYIEGIGTDEMRIARKHRPMPRGSNRPTLQGRDVDVLEYSEHIISGFTGMYTFLQDHRDELSPDGGVLEQFAQDEVRVILRPTHIYSLLLRESYHPDVLRDAIDRDLFIDRLWTGVEDQPRLMDVIQAEREDLWRNDIPVFTTTPDSPHLWTSTYACVPNFFDQSGMALVRERLAQLSPDDLHRQCWFIRASFTTLLMGKAELSMPTYALDNHDWIAEPTQLIQAARLVGDRLDELAIRGSGDATWIGVAAVQERYWDLVPLGLDLYNGLPGVAFFLAYLGAVTGEERYTTLAEAALKSVQRQIEQNNTTIDSIGGFSGWGGVIYMLSHLGTLWRRPELFDQAEAVVDRIEALIEQDTHFDVLGGAAGCIGGLLSLYHCRPSARILAVALRCADWLISHVQMMPQGCGWLTPIADKPLAGFAHGNAGISWALLKLAAVADVPHIRPVAEAALTYERRLFVPEANNWRDLRKGDASSSYMTAWCHGAIGIGLARLDTLSELIVADCRAELEVTLQTALTDGFGRNHSLCHGDLGSVELFIQASQTLNDPLFAEHARRMAGQVLRSIKQYGWLCGIPLGVETPSLMTGLAGIGYGLLRVANPTQVPSVMLLEPPQL